MERFAALVDALVYTRSRNGKLGLIADYLTRIIHERGCFWLANVA